jgi:hypothetical protein
MVIIGIRRRRLELSQKALALVEAIENIAQIEKGALFLSIDHRRFRHVRPPPRGELFGRPRQASREPCAQSREPLWNRY